MFRKHAASTVTHVLDIESHSTGYLETLGVCNNNIDNFVIRSQNCNLFSCLIFYNIISLRFVFAFCHYEADSQQLRVNFTMWKADY